MSFIQRIIENTLIKQPPWIQGTVLFIFVFLFIYMVIFTTQGSIILITELRIPQATGSAKPELGYQIALNHEFYGLNSAGQVRLDLSIPTYLAALAARKLQLTVAHPRPRWPRLSSLNRI
jgi:hypothetical protein